VIILSVRLVVLFIEREQIIECETVMTGHEIDALFWRLVRRFV
jgi:hypothetical protein